jgi:hypothetical protein
LTHRIVVDGSNIAHHGRQKTPSLNQLLTGVEALATQYPGADILLIVDANFAHRIDNNEVAKFRRESRQRPILQPPSGTVGRGDALVCAVGDQALKANDSVVIVTNDSYAEHQAAYPWLLDEGRVLGGTLVPGLGWVFLPRKIGPTRDPAEAKPTLVVGGDDQEAAGRVKWDEPLREWEAEILEAEPAEGMADTTTATANASTPDAVANVWYEAGQVVEGTVAWVSNYGAFVALERGGKGLVHKSELSEDVVTDVRDVINRGETMFVLVQGRNEKGHYRLSKKDADTKARGQFDAAVYLAELSYDEEGNYIYPVGFDPDAGEWLPEFEDERLAWEAQYFKAQSAWERHRELLRAEGVVFPDIQGM